MVDREQGQTIHISEVFDNLGKKQLREATKISVFSGPATKASEIFFGASRKKYLFLVARPLFYLSFS